MMYQKRILINEYIQRNLASQLVAPQQKY